MFRKLLLICFIVGILPFTVFAQSIGKIAGLVTDEATGEPLPGVNITLDNTTFGDTGMCEYRKGIVSSIKFMTKKSHST